MKRILKELWEFRWWGVGSIVGIAFAAMADLWLPALLARIIKEGVGQSSSGSVYQIGFIMLGVAVLSLVGAIFGNYCAARLGTDFAKKIRHKLFYKVQTLGQGEINQFGTASLITRNTNDVQQVQQFVMMFVRIFVRAPILLIGGSIMAFSISPSLAKPLLFSIPSILLIVFLISRYVVPVFKVLQDKLDSVNRILREQISGIRVVRAFGTEEHESERFDDVSADYTKTSLKMIRTITLMNPLLTMVMNLTVVAILLLSISQVNGGTLTDDSLIIPIVQYVMQIMFSLVLMSMMFILYPRAVASAERISQVLEVEPSIIDLKETKAPQSGVTGTIEFRGVSFTFPDAERPTLEAVNFTVNKGETTAIIGSTGSGKSTLLRLILRFYDVTQGRILVDGVDIRELSQQDLRSRISYVPQKSSLFSGTIADNLAFGKENPSPEEMTTAATTAQALEFIETEEGQFQAHVAQGGTNYSGGQKQRISITRALVRQPEILLFDDSFSALDAATDLRLRKSLAKDMADTTQIIVAQRVSSISGSDQIIVLDNGLVVGKGTHKELLVSCSVYKEIADSQFSEEEVAQ